MRILVTGASGFVGRHLVTELLRSHHQVFLADLREQNLSTPEFGTRRIHKMDITNPTECDRITNEFAPEALVHLAGIAQSTGQNSDLLTAVNVQGAANVLSSFSKIVALSNKVPRIFLYVSSAFIYGGDVNTGTLSCNETTPTCPRGAYGQSKLAAESILRKFDSPSLSIYVARPFNHIGPGQDTSFVVPALAARIHNVAAGGTIETGNLESLRDFTDVRDVVRAYRLILENRPSAKLFVIGSGKLISIQTIFDQLKRLSGKSFNHEIASHLKRDESTAAFVADYSLANSKLGWKPELSIEETVAAVFREYTRPSP